MEILISVAIILILGSLLVTSSGAVMQTSAKSNTTVKTAETITRIDRHIRERADNFHIPYWANPVQYINTFNSELFGSSIGSYIKTIRVITDNNRIPKGIEAVYTVNNLEMKTVALFSSKIILDTMP